jgi:hypothetical protein
MRLIILILILSVTKLTFSQVDNSLLESFFSNREITPKYEVSSESVLFVSMDVGVWAPQDLKVLFHDSIINRGDIGPEPNEKRKYLEDNLDKKDFDYIDEQILAFSKFEKWTAEVQKNVSLINLESYESGRMWIYSKPLFNQKLDFCIIKISYYCGDKCAFSCIYSYKKNRNNIWKIDEMIYSYLPWSNYQILSKEILEKDIVKNMICTSKTDSIFVGKKVKIVNGKEVYDYLCSSSTKGIDWPSSEIKNNSGVCSEKWEGVKNGGTATIIWKFENFKTSSGDNVFIIKIDDLYVPIACSGLELIVKD